MSESPTAAPRVLCIDDGAFDDPWGWLGLLPPASESVLFLRNIDLTTYGGMGGYATRHMILDNCWAPEISLSTVLDRLPHLETLVFFETVIEIDDQIDDLASKLIALQTPIRHVHIIEHNFKIYEDQPNAQHVLPHLQSFTYKLLSDESESQTHAGDGPDRDALAKVQQAVESILHAPQCTFKYQCSTESPEDALANALAALDLDL